RPEAGHVCQRSVTARERQHRLRRGSAAWLQADRVLRVGGLRSDPEGPDADGWNPLLQVQRVRARLRVLQREHQHRPGGGSSQWGVHERPGALCGFPINLDKSESGFRSRGNLTWHITPDMMAYYTFSQGFRPGGFNRTHSDIGAAPILSGVAKYCGNIAGAQNAPDPRCLPGGSLAGLNTSQFNKPAGFNSDNQINNEIGFKSEFFEHRLVLNLSAY